MSNQPYKSSFAPTSFTPTSNHAGTTNTEKKRIKTFIIAGVVVLIALLLVIISVVKATLRNSFNNEELAIPQDSDQY